MPRILSALFFLSGGAALLFETLWFRQAGLAFGNSVWASSLVLGSFMAGLALGNACMARYGDRVRHPVRLYAGLEAAIGLAGVTLVLVLPTLGAWCAPIFRPLLDHPWLLNPLRLGLGFGLLVVPATAMGATLPVLVKVLMSWDASFGSALGRLYGWNTLGAVFGAVGGEVFLVGRLGVHGTAWVAAGLNAVAAGVAFVLSRGRPRVEAPKLPVAREPPPGIDAVGRRVLAATFVAGGVLLAFEVVWFRFLRLFVNATSVVFAILLAVVLAGIALGGFAAARWLRRDAAAPRHTAMLASLSGALAIALYGLFSLPLSLQPNYQLSSPDVIVELSLTLMFPVALLSGILFPFMGVLLQERLSAETRAAGLLTLANTLGAALGSALGGFVLLPVLGMERSFCVLGAAYGGVALLVWNAAPTPLSRLGSRARIGAAGALAGALVLFPAGKMQRVYLPTSIGRWDPDHTEQVVAVREGTTETSVYLRKAVDDETIQYRLLTDGFAMSGTWAFSRRYQKLYVYWPVAVHPAPRRALVISYGVGSTAKALVDTVALEQIDVVDISRDLLEMSHIVYPDPSEDPLRDPRVRVHVEDGRFFLQVTAERYDIITGEPPPPKNAGVVNLYTREYFQLIHDRLAPGGIATYWLPVHNTLESDTKAIVGAFCEVFADCSLWSGIDLDWMLVGSRRAQWTRSESLFVRQWSDPGVASELRAVGVEVPEQLGALFIADAAQLGRFIADTPPLTDDWPKRLGDGEQTVEDARETYRDWLDAGANRRRFLASRFIVEVWPPALRERSLPYFDLDRMVEDSFVGKPMPFTDRLRRVERLLRETSLETLPLWCLEVSGDGLRAVQALLARGVPDERFIEPLARAAVARRDLEQALLLLERIDRPRDRDLIYLRGLLLALTGRGDEARQLARSNGDWLPRDERSRSFWTWLGGLEPLPRRGRP